MSIPLALFPSLVVLVLLMLYFMTPKFINRQEIRLQTLIRYGLIPSFFLLLCGAAGISLLETKFDIESIVCDAAFVLIATSLVSFFIVKSIKKRLNGNKLIRLPRRSFEKRMATIITCVAAFFALRDLSKASAARLLHISWLAFGVGAGFSLFFVIVYIYIQRLEKHSGRCIVVVKGNANVTNI